MTLIADPLERLEPTPRAVVELLAVAHDALDLGRIAACLEAMEARPLGVGCDTRTVLSALQQLEVLELVVLGGSPRLQSGLGEGVVRRLIHAGRFEPLAALVDRVVPLRGGTARPGSLRRELRRALVAGDAAGFDGLLQRWPAGMAGQDGPPRLAGWLDQPLERELLRRQPPALAGELAADLSLLRAERMAGGQPLLPLLRELAGRQPQVPSLRVALGRQAALAGDVPLATRAVQGLGSVEALAVEGLLALMSGDVSASVRRYARALSLRRRRDGAGCALLEGPEGALQPLAYLLHPSTSRRVQARRLLAAQPLDGPARDLFSGHPWLQRLGEPPSTLAAPPVDHGHPVAVLVASLVCWWLGEPLDSGLLDVARGRAAASDAGWLSAELDALFAGDPHRALPGGLALMALRPGSGGGSAPALPSDRERVDTLVQRLRQQAAPLEAGAGDSAPHDPRPVLRLIPSGFGLAVEVHGADPLLARLPTLDSAPRRGGHRWLEGLEPAMALLAELEALGEAVRVEWPAGEPLRLRGDLGPDSLFMSARGRGDWFAASGELRVDRELVVQLHELLALMGGRPRRFVQLHGGQIIALNSALQRQLAMLGCLLEQGPGHELRVHRLAVGAVDPLLDELGGVTVDEAWRLQLQAMGPTVPGEHPVPRSMLADLRSYQREGYAWLARLSELGAGACLADDMGVGKTVQVLALLLQRAWLGPALVVAPTSVCGGWCQEAARFAPDLRVQRFGPGDRTARLDALGSGDLLVCSYGLLQTEREALAAVTWSTAVLDEAQAIKNPDTRRHRAACALRAEQRVITTGTPIENHTGELWSLFRFLNPGLLGSWERFRARFADPIERGEHEPLQQLRRLVLPFILRRTKAAVLRELPPRSVQRVEVDLLPAERALYTATRERAEDWLESLDDPQPLQILAQLTKLRMACCNAALVVDASVAPDSAKLAAFADLVQQLRRSGQRALVFSQFVRHLAVLRAWLDTRGVDYQYLDGSTPAARRDRAVSAFQAGQGELFLISLRAGGFGLNLTAAEAVIHMDPWWNPAVEDQASDRAHRIGQQRPVTVYRLVARGTIEEKILALHAHKRELAEGLLEGSDAAGRLSALELMGLIREA
jgi:hypothetical protein